MWHLAMGDLDLSPTLRRGRIPGEHLNLHCCAESVITECGKHLTQSRGARNAN